MRTGVFRFGDFVLDVPAYELRRQGRSVRLERRPMELLLLLVERRGDLITRDDIVARLWGRDVFIDIDTSVNRGAATAALLEEILAARPSVGARVS